MSTSIVDRIRPALAALLLAGCGAAAEPPRSYPEPQDPAGRQAAAILRECGALGAAEVMGCYERSLLGQLEAEGVASAMTTLERMGEMDLDVRRDGHVYAHAIGLAAYTTPAEVSRVFDRCTPSFQSGCYHGVIQSYFVDQAREHGAAGLTAEAVNAVCAGTRGSGDLWKLFQCAHGIGHGVTLLNEHHLPRSLAGCDLVADAWEREACYGGVFMENVVQATAPHHTVGRPQHGAAAAAPGAGHGAEHGEHHGDHEAAPAFAPLDPSRPLYPCTELEERYLFSCYQMQTSAILFHNGGDVAGAAAACGEAPELYRAVCFQSLGRDVSARTVQEHGEARRLCALAGEENRAECHVGYVKNVVDVTARADAGFDFCRTLPDERDKTRCYQAVGEEVAVLVPTPERRAGACAEAEPGYQAACRRGAGLPKGE